MSDYELGDYSDEDLLNELQLRLVNKTLKPRKRLLLQVSVTKFQNGQRYPSQTVSVPQGSEAVVNLPVESADSVERVYISCVPWNDHG